MKIFRDWTFKWWEMGLLKVCLLSLGIMLGLYFYNAIVSFVWIWWILVAVPIIYFIIKILTDKTGEQVPVKKTEPVISKIPEAKEVGMTPEKKPEQTAKGPTPPPVKEPVQQPAKEPIMPNKPPVQATAPMTPKEPVQPVNAQFQANKAPVNTPPQQAQNATPAQTPPAQPRPSVPPTQGTMPMK